MTQKELAKELNMTEVGVSKIVNGSTTKATMTRIADLLDVSVEDLTDKRTRVKYKGELNLNGLIIPCYVLEDSTRVLSGRGMQEALKMVDTEEGKQTAGTRLNRYLSQKSLNPFISKYLDMDHFAPIICTDNGKVIHGYKAGVLADICEAFLEARNEMKLSPRQAIIADQCELLMRAFARVGIIALVDEATGYDKAKEKAKNELQKFLNQFLQEEAAKWVKTFTDQFFEDIYKMRNWTWTQTSQRPGVIGQWIKDIVYDRLGPVVPELERLNPKNANGNRSHKHHQFLSRDIGLPRLKEHLAAVHAIAVISNYDWATFKFNLDKAYPSKNSELFLNF